MENLINQKIYDRIHDSLVGQIAIALLLATFRAVSTRHASPLANFGILSFIDSFAFIIVDCYHFHFRIV